MSGKLHRWDPVPLAVTSCPSCRSPDALDEVIDQFSVETNPRYAPEDVTGDGRDETWCNLFAWDVTRALCAELPHWWRGRELTANGLYDWLLQYGRHFGWGEGRAVEALAAANAGRPAVAAAAGGERQQGHSGQVATHRHSSSYSSASSSAYAC